MAGFAAAWLDRREAADAACRDAALARRLRAHLAPLDLVTVADLGAGTGANLRWLASRLPRTQHWHLLEDDPALVAGMAPRLDAWARRHAMQPSPVSDGMTLAGSLTLRATWRRVDLRADPLPLGRADLVTASALADLVSEAWLQRLVSRCAEDRSCLLLAVNYDGRVDLTPHHAFDAPVRDAHNRHQLGDKGFGPALGPRAVAVATHLLRALRYRVFQARSDWRLDRRQAALARLLVDGWKTAAREILEPPARPALDAWHAWRTAQLTARDSRVRVGHVDLLALPPT